MSTKTLFLAWQYKRGEDRLWFPLGRLDIEPSLYRFRYTGGAVRAQQELNYPPLLSFPQLHRDYRSSALFYQFQNRVMKPNRPDFADHVQRLDLPESADPFEMLSVSGGYRVTDDYEVFPKLVKAKDGSFVCRFFLHGWRHTSLPAQETTECAEAGRRTLRNTGTDQSSDWSGCTTPDNGLPHDWLDPALYRSRDGEGNG